MKKTRKIIALVLALTFMFCFMAMSASAATTEIQPRGIACDCGSSNTRTTNNGYKRYSHTEVGGCSEYPSVRHLHVVYKTEYEFKCYTCGEHYTYYASPSYYACESRS